jgi:hypothetical protein
LAPHTIAARSCRITVPSIDGLRRVSPKQFSILVSKNA